MSKKYFLKYYIIVVCFLVFGVIYANATAMYNQEKCITPDEFLGGGKYLDGLSDSDIAAVVMDGASSSTAMTILNSGRCLQYMQTWKDMGLIPQDFYPAGSAPAPAATPAPSTSAASAEAPASSASQTTATEQTAPEVTEEAMTGTYVNVEDVVVYSTMDGTDELGTLVVGTPVSITGATSNGRFKFAFEGYDVGYASADSFVSDTEYEAAWEETEREEATCSEPGKVVRTNSITGLTETEEIPTIEHVYEIADQTDPTCIEEGTITYSCVVCGDAYEESVPALGHDDGEWVVAKEAGSFTEGLKELRCTRDGEVLDSEVLPQTFPISLAKLIGLIVIAGAAAVAIVLVVVLRKKAATKEQKIE